MIENARRPLGVTKGSGVRVGPLRYVNPVKGVTRRVVAPVVRKAPKALLRALPGILLEGPGVRSGSPVKVLALPRVSRKPSLNVSERVLFDVAGYNRNLIARAPGMPKRQAPSPKSVPAPLVAPVRRAAPKPLPIAAAVQVVNDRSRYKAEQAAYRAANCVERPDPKRARAKRGSGPGSEEPRKFVLWCK